MKPWTVEWKSKETVVQPYIVDDVIHPVGNDWAAVVKLNQPDTDPAVPLDITGWTFWTTITKDKTWDDSEAYVHKSFTPSNPASWQINLSVRANQLMVPGIYCRDIKAKSATGACTTLVTGIFELVAVPTKAL